MDPKVVLSLISIYKKRVFKSDKIISIIKLKKLGALFLLQYEENQVMKRRYWVHPIFSTKSRKLHGASETLIKELYFYNDEKFINYFRMTIEIYEKLLDAVGPYITKQNCVRNPILPNTRLEICLRYLASGDSMKSLSYAFRVGHSTVSKIVLETCEAIWNVLQHKVYPKFNNNVWKHISSEYEKQWNFPHCIGALDGKHVIIQVPPNSGSIYYNYKGRHSLNLLALCDAHYRFTYVDIGAAGRQSDSGVFQNSKLYAALENNALQIPLPESVGVRGPVLPYVIVADDAFALRSYMMRPYTRNKKLNQKKKIFNYRLSRARRVIESSFGILAARWQVYRKPIIASISLSRKIVQATCCLHNFIINHEGKNRYYSSITSADLKVACEGFQDCVNEKYSYCKTATTIRNTFAEYFQEDGAVIWQWEKALHNEF